VVFNKGVHAGGSSINMDDDVKEGVAVSIGDREHSAAVITN